MDLSTSSKGFAVEQRQESVLLLKRAALVIQGIKASDVSTKRRQLPELRTCLLDVIQSVMQTARIFRAEECMALLASIADLLRMTVAEDVDDEVVDLFIAVVGQGVGLCLQFLEGQVESSALAEQAQSIKETWSAQVADWQSPESMPVVYNGLCASHYRKWISVFVKRQQWQEVDEQALSEQHVTIIGIFDDAEVARKALARQGDLVAFVVVADDCSESLELASGRKCYRCSIGLLSFTINRHLKSQNQQTPQPAATTCVKRDVLAVITSLHGQCRDFLERAQHYTDVTDPEKMPLVWDMRQKIVKAENVMLKLRALMKVKGSCRNCSVETCNEEEQRKWNVVRTMLSRITEEVQEIA